MDEGVLIRTYGTWYRAYSPTLTTDLPGTCNHGALADSGVVVGKHRLSAIGLGNGDNVKCSLTIEARIEFRGS